MEEGKSQNSNHLFANILTRHIAHQDLKKNVPILKSIALPSVGIFLQGFLFQSGAGGKSRGGGWRGESVRRCKA